MKQASLYLYSDYAEGNGAWSGVHGLSCDFILLPYHWTKKKKKSRVQPCKPRLKFPAVSPEYTVVVSSFTFNLVVPLQVLTSLNI